MTDLLLRPFEERDWPDMVRFYEEFYRPGYIFTQRPFFEWNFASPLRPDDRSGQRQERFDTTWDEAWEAIRGGMALRRGVIASS